MRLAKFRHVVEVENLQQLHEHLRFRDDNGYACFWLWHDNESQLAVMVHGNEASVHFFPYDNHPGFIPVIAGGVESDEMIEFRADNSERDVRAAFVCHVVGTSVACHRPVLRLRGTPSLI